MWALSEFCWQFQSEQGVKMEDRFFTLDIKDVWIVVNNKLWVNLGGSELTTLGFGNGLVRYHLCQVEKKCTDF